MHLVHNPQGPKKRRLGLFYFRLTACMYLIMAPQAALAGSVDRDWDPTGRFAEHNGNNNDDNTKLAYASFRLLLFCSSATNLGHSNDMKTPTSASEVRVSQLFLVLIPEKLATRKLPFVFCQQSVYVLAEERLHIDGAKVHGSGGLNEPHVRRPRRSHGSKGRRVGLSVLTDSCRLGGAARVGPP